MENILTSVSGLIDDIEDFFEEEEEDDEEEEEDDGVLQRISVDETNQQGGSAHTETVNHSVSRGNNNNVPINPVEVGGLAEVLPSSKRNSSRRKLRKKALKQRLSGMPLLPGERKSTGTSTSTIIDEETMKQIRDLIEELPPVPNHVPEVSPSQPSIRGTISSAVSVGWGSLKDWMKKT